MSTHPCSRPAANRTIRSSAGIVKKQAKSTAKMADHGNKCYVPGCAGGCEVQGWVGVCIQKGTESK